MDEIRRERIPVDDRAEIERNTGHSIGDAAERFDLHDTSRSVAHDSIERRQTEWDRLTAAKHAIRSLTYGEMLELVEQVESGPRPSAGKLDLAKALSRWASD